MTTKWETVKTIGYDGRYDHGPNVDRAATGAVVHLQCRKSKSGVKCRAVTSNGRFSFITPLSLAECEWAK